jgi:GT2 family glycosyltransferase
VVTVKHTPLVAIVPSRNLLGMLGTCLCCLNAALENISDRVTEICVVDNSSHPPYEQLRQISKLSSSTVRFDSHQSFSTCVNTAAGNFPNHDLVLVNNDCFVSSCVLADMLKILEQSQVGIVGSRLIFPDGSIQHDGVGLSSNGPFHLRRGQDPALFSFSKTYPDAVTGALMLIRRQVFDEIQGFDESYPFGLEDIDFCHRARAKGWQIACVHLHPALHFESFTPGRIELDIHSRDIYKKRWTEKLDGNPR